MMPNEKMFDPRALASITCGTLLIPDFSKVHEAIEHVMGHPVWTHELPALAETAAAPILARYPDMPTSSPNDWQATAAALTERYGDAIPIARGNAERTADPVTTLAAMIGRPS